MYFRFAALDRANASREHADQVLGMASLSLPLSLALSRIQPRHGTLCAAWKFGARLSLTNMLVVSTQGELMNGVAPYEAVKSSFNVQRPLEFFSDTPLI
jgi:hypothetical protein